MYQIKDIPLFVGVKEQFGIAKQREMKIVSESGKVLGYAPLIIHFSLVMPYPRVFSLIASSNKKSSC